MNDDIVEKIEQAGLIGRGGAGYPTAKKWRDIKSVQSDKKYVICNASEGEIGLFKDIHILENHPEEVVHGMELALDYLETNKAFFNINRNYYERIGPMLREVVQHHNYHNHDFQFFIEEPSYIGGEETALLNAIEGKRTEPRQKPPFPSVFGLFGRPTLINNVETFFNVALVDKNEYKGDRFYCISGPVNSPGVYHLPADWDIAKVLRETGNYPDFEFFVQLGGSASGLVFNQEQANTQKMVGAGGLEIYPKDTAPKDLLLRWLYFYQRESCGKCAPCRMGTYALKEIIEESTEIPWDEIFKVLEVTKETSFCGLGKSVNEPIESYYSNVIKEQ